MVLTQILVDCPFARVCDRWTAVGWMQCEICDTCGLSWAGVQLLICIHPTLIYLSQTLIFALTNPSITTRACWGSYWLWIFRKWARFVEIWETLVNDYFRFCSVKHILCKCGHLGPSICKPSTISNYLTRSSHCSPLIWLKAILTGHSLNDVIKSLISSPTGVYKARESWNGFYVIIKTAPSGKIKRAYEKFIQGRHLLQRDFPHCRDFRINCVLYSQLNIP